MIIPNKLNHQKSVEKSTNNNRGFTLLEVLIATTIFAIIVALIVDEYASQQGQSITQQQAVEMQQTARASMFLMSRRIRAAGYDPEGKNDAGITTAGDGSSGNPLTFTYYVDFGEDGLDNDQPPDGLIDNVGEQGTGYTLKTFTYVLNDQDGDGDTDLVINEGGGNQLMAENVSALNFSYFDQNNNITAALDDIRAIQIATTATTDSNELDRSDGNNLRTLTSIIKCRNLGL